MSNPILDYPPGTLLSRPDGRTAEVTAISDERAAIVIQRPAVNGRLPTPESWEGDPADLANCWNVVPVAR